MKKRGLFRKAEQVVRYCNSEVFIIVHNLDSDKIFSFTSDKDFDLEKISDLVLRDCQQGALLNKNRKFENVDFEKVKRNITQIQKLNSMASNNQMGSPIISSNHHYLMDKDQMVPDETITEDMSVSMQHFGSNQNEQSAPHNNGTSTASKMIRSPKNNLNNARNHLNDINNHEHLLGSYNSHSNNGTYENAQFSPKHVAQPRSEHSFPV